MRRDEMTRKTIASVERIGSSPDSGCALSIVSFRRVPFLACSAGAWAVDEQVDEGASSRGAAGWDIRFSDVPEELIEACKERLESLPAERSTTTSTHSRLLEALTFRSDRFEMHSYARGSNKPRMSLRALLFAVEPSPCEFAAKSWSGAGVTAGGSPN